MQNFDAVIIGAGIQGLSTAYHIVRHSDLSVAVIEEMHNVGQGSSRRSGSMLMKSRENKAKIMLSLYSYDRLMDFESEFGQSLRFRRTGFVSLVNEGLADEYMRQHAIRVSMGVPSEVLDTAAIRQLSPGLDLREVEFGLYCGDDGEIDVAQIVTAYREASERLGATYMLGVAATGVKVRSGRIAGVKTTKGNIACGAVVNAGGPRAAEVATWAGAQLPIRNLARSLYFVDTPHPNFQDGPMVEDAASEWYFRALGRGRVLIGMGLEPSATVGDGVNKELWPHVQRMCKQRAPVLSTLTPVGGSTGFRSLTPDILPIVGPAQGIDNLYHNCGWGGEGIMHSPAGGLLTASWVLGQMLDSRLDQSPFLPSRFGVDQSR